MVARYNVERLSFGMDPVKPLAPNQWQSGIPLGYDPRLNTVTGYRYGARPNNARLNMQTQYATLRLLETDIDHMGYSVVINGTVQAEGPLQAVGGRDEGINIVGGTVSAGVFKIIIITVIHTSFGGWPSVRK